MKSILILAALSVVAVFIVGFQTAENKSMKKQANVNADHLKKATFAGGCFWCVEADFEKVNGVVEAVSGYTGGHLANPTYKEVSAGIAGYGLDNPVDSLEIRFDTPETTAGESGFLQMVGVNSCLFFDRFIFCRLKTDGEHGHY